MLKSVLCVLSTLLITDASAASAQSTADNHCQQWIIDNGQYQAGFGTIELSGPPLMLGTWSAEYSVMTMTFPEQVVVLTTANVRPGALGDYIATTVTHRKGGFEAFGVITDDADGNRLSLVQPFESDGDPNCFASVVNVSE